MPNDYSSAGAASSITFEVTVVPLLPASQNRLLLAGRVLACSEMEHMLLSNNNPHQE